MIGTLTFLQRLHCRRRRRPPPRHWRSGWEKSWRRRSNGATEEQTDCLARGVPIFIVGSRMCTVCALYVRLVCALYVHCMCTVCAPCVHCVCVSVCAPYVRCVCTSVCALYVHCVALYVHCVCVSVCAKYVRCVCTVCAWCVQRDNSVGNGNWWGCVFALFLAANRISFHCAKLLFDFRNGRARLQQHCSAGLTPVRPGVRGFCQQLCPDYDAVGAGGSTPPVFSTTSR